MSQRNKTMNTEQIKKVVELYHDNKSSRQIAKETGISATQVRRLLKAGGIQAKTNKKSLEEERLIFDSYTLGESSESIAKRLAISPRTVCSIIKRLGGEIRPSTENKRKYAINKEFFKKIDSEEKAYALGFMYADGNIHNRLSFFNIMLHKKDRDVLDMFNSWIYVSENRVEQCNDERYVNFRVSSVEMVNDLIRLGCVPAKTFKLNLPYWLANDRDLFRHFVRGFLDGDGCISVQKSGRVRVVFTGYNQFLLQLKLAIENQCSVSIDIREVKPKVADLVIGPQSSTRNFLHWLYDDSNVFMNRKKEKCELALSILDDKASKSLKSSTLLNFNGQKLSAKNILAMSVEERDCASQFVFEHFRDRGFPYDRYEYNELVSDFRDLERKSCSVVQGENRIYSNPEAGLKIFRHFCDHYYDVNNNRLPSMHDAFNDDEMLMKAIKNRMGISYSETFNITGRMIRQGLRNGHVAFAASVFKPSVAKFFYKKFNAKRVLDISAGFGQRMLGAAAAGIEKYVATDPWDKTIVALKGMMDFIAPLSNTDIEIIHGGSENLSLDQEFDFCFSSPPFFDKEVYSQDAGQAYFGGYEEYMNWWQKTMTNVYSSLIDGSYFVINMDSKIARDMIDNASGFFKLEDEYFINFNRKHMSKDSKDMYYVLRKI